MNSMEEVSDDVRVKNEPICYSQSISDTKEANMSNIQPNKTRLNDMQSIKQEKRTREDISIYNQPNKRKRHSILVKKEPIDSEKSQILKEVEVKAEEEEKFSSREEFSNKTSIAFLNEETNLEATTNDNKAYLSRLIKISLQ
jgi:hypothetical protein